MEVKNNTIDKPPEKEDELVVNAKTQALNSSKAEDERIIKEILSGDINKFSILQKKYYYLVFSLVKKMIPDYDDADDIMQESFIKAYRSLKSYSPEYAFASWLYKITSNNCIDFIRRKKALLPVFQCIDIDEESEIADNTYLPDLNVLGKEKSDIIKKAINELPDKYKNVINQKYEENNDYQTISNNLNMPIGTVKVNLFRAKKMLELSLRKHSDVFNLKK